VAETWPSVTTILAAVGLGPDYSAVPPAILEVARLRGQAVHEAIEAAHLGYEINDPLPGDWRPYLEASRAFARESGAQAERLEFRVAHPQWRYVGHPDWTGYILGKRALIDWKCMDALRPGDLLAATYQLAGYLLALEAERPTERIEVAAVVQLRSDGTYRLREVDARSAGHVFLAAVTVYAAREELRAA
jgi:hypothetical protein